MKLASPQDNYLPGQIPSLPLKAVRKGQKNAWIFIAVSFIGAGLVFLVLHEAFSPDHHEGRHGITGLLVMICLFITVMPLYFLMNGRNLFELTAEGIKPNSDQPVVHWHNISGAKIVSLMGQPFVGIFLKNEENYFSSLTSYQKEFARTSIQLSQTPIVLAPTAARIQNDDLVTWINHYKNILGV